MNSGQAFQYQRHKSRCCKFDDLVRGNFRRARKYAPMEIRPVCRRISPLGKVGITCLTCCARRGVVTSGEHGRRRRGEGLRRQLRLKFWTEAGTIARIMRAPAARHAI
ncbi:MAG: hypothetical protein LBJ94_00670 [Puniceicoccales bacterium]|nr:hypothetical protein [Puniceicoccales bacterium]